MQLNSAAYRHGEAIPRRFTCDGENISPEISWRDAPKETKSFVLVLHDPDAPRRNGFAHWLVYNISHGVAAIDAGAPRQPSLPGIGLQGSNDGGTLGYTGPCPPSGTHRYFFRLYALRDELDLPPGATYDQLIAAIEGKIIEQTELMGTYARTSQQAA